MQDNDPSLFLNDTLLQQLNEFPLLYFTPNVLRMNYEDVLNQEALLDFQDLLMPPSVPLSLEDIETYYHQPAANIPENESHSEHSEPTIVTHFSYPIHFAARDGNTEEIEFYAKQGFDVNQKDLHSIVPLHVAAMFGQYGAAKTLLSLGANVDAKGYENHTPLHFALVKHRFDIANLLLQENANPLEIDHKGNNAFSIIINTLTTQFINYQHPTNAKLAKINQIFSVIDTMVTTYNDERPFLYNEILQIKGNHYLIPTPCSLALQAIASHASNKAFIDTTLELVNRINARDPSWQHFLHAKDLLHRFPTGELYKFKSHPNLEIYFSSEGHFGVFTTQLAANSLEHFIEKMDEPESDLKFSIFQSLKNIYDHAKEYAQYASLNETAEKALGLYNQGETILLPSGWNGHFVDVILSKTQAFYVIANSGDRYHGEAPTYEPDPPGIIFYKLHEPEKISEQFIHKTLTNTERMSLEYENPYEYGMIEKVDDIIRENQLYGNCGWESHRNAVEGLIYIELLNRNIPHAKAKNLANAYYEEWDQFHGNFVIDNYFSGEPGLPFKAMLDMLQQLHLKTYFTEMDHLHSQKIAESLLSPFYIHDFQDWISNSHHDSTDRLMLNILQEQHGIDIHHLTNNLWETQDVSDVPILFYTPPIESPVIQEL